MKTFIITMLYVFMDGTHKTQSYPEQRYTRKECNAFAKQLNGMAWLTVGSEFEGKKLSIAIAKCKDTMQ